MTSTSSGEGLPARLMSTAWARLCALLAVIALGSFAALCVLTGVAAFRGGPVRADTGVLDAGRDPHATIIELAGAQVELGVPFPAMWGQVYLLAESESELFLGATELTAARDYLAGTAYAFITYDAAWRALPVPGEGRPADPIDAAPWRSTSVGTSVGLPAEGTLVLMRADARRPIQAQTSMEFRPGRAGVLIGLFAVITVLCLILSIRMVQRGLRPRAAAAEATDG